MKGIAGQILKRLRSASSLGAERLPDDFVLPAYDGYSLGNVPATILDHFGVGSTPLPPLAPEVTGDILKGSQKLVVMLVDALGYMAATAQMAADRSLGLNALARRGRFVPLTSIFPTTTAACLSTLYTGRGPAGHGITGYRMYLSEQGAIANMIRLSPEADERSNRLLQRPGDARALLGVPTVHQLLARGGVKSYCLIQDTIYRSGLSEMLFTGAAGVIPFVNSSDLFVQVRKLLETDAGAPSCIWAYWGALDTIQHVYGTGGEEPAAEVRSLCYALQRELLEAVKLPGRRKATLMVLADHGHIQVEAGDIISASRFPKLREMLAVPPTGTGRSVYLHLRKGEIAGQEAYLKRALGKRALVFRSRDALAEGLWGPGEVRPEVSGRVGDLLALMQGSHAFFYPYWAGARPAGLVGGRHGGLHEQEVLIPFFCVGL